MKTATGTFTFDTWESDDDDVADGIGVGHVRAVKRFADGLQGRSVLHMCTGMAGEVQTYVASELYDVTLDGRGGTFLARQTAAMGGDTEPLFAVDIIRGSGTGELAGITGTITIENNQGNHSVTIDYELP